MLALLVDGLNLVRRVYAAVPGDEGTPEHAEDVLRSCTRSLERALAELAPTHAVCAFESPGEGWRHEMFPAYKSGRPPMPAPLAELLPRIRDAFAERGVRCVAVAGFEADDVLASIAVRVAEHGGECVILSTDKSMLSLLRDGVCVRNHFEDRELDETYVRARFAIAPSQLGTWLALVGDSSASVPGVKSVGPKTATHLVHQHGDLESILAAAADMPGRVGKALREHAEDARLAYRLLGLRTDVEVGLNLSECRVAAGTP